MKGVTHKFLKECKMKGVTPIISEKFYCDFDKKEIGIPVQNSNLNLFFGLHELAHFVLHKNDKRDYSDLLSRIKIEREADSWANSKMEEFLEEKYNIISNQYTIGLIALHLYEGGTYQNFEIEIDSFFIILQRYGIEIFSQFISNLPIHPIKHF